MSGSSQESQSMHIRVAYLELNVVQYGYIIIQKTIILLKTRTFIVIGLSNCWLGPFCGLNTFKGFVLHV